MSTTDSDSIEVPYRSNRPKYRSDEFTHWSIFWTVAFASACGVLLASLVQFIIGIMLANAMLNNYRLKWPDRANKAPAHMEQRAPTFNAPEIPELSKRGHWEDQRVPSRPLEDCKSLNGGLINAQTMKCANGYRRRVWIED